MEVERAVVGARWCACGGINLGGGDGRRLRLLGLLIKNDCKYITQCVFYTLRVCVCVCVYVCVRVCVCVWLRLRGYFNSSFEVGKHGVVLFTKS